MRRMFWPLIGLFALIICVGAIFFAARSLPMHGANVQHPVLGTALPKSQTLSYPVGVPAIKPSGTVPSTPVLTPGVTPAVTTADVKAFFAANGFPPTPPGVQPVIEKILFIPSGQASSIMQGETVGRPDNVLVCYVLLQGPFHVVISEPYWPTTPTTSGNVTPPEYPYPHIEEVFDAYSGNLLVFRLPPK